MKKLILAALSSILCGGALAEGDSVIAYTLREDGTTNTWTQAELQAALGLINRMYKREIGTDAGRRKCDQGDPQEGKAQDLVDLPALINRNCHRQGSFI